MFQDILFIVSQYDDGQWAINQDMEMWFSSASNCYRSRGRGWGFVTPPGSSSTLFVASLYTYLKISFSCGFYPNRVVSTSWFLPPQCGFYLLCFLPHRVLSTSYMVSTPRVVSTLLCGFFPLMRFLPSCMFFYPPCGFYPLWFLALLVVSSSSTPPCNTWPATADAPVDPLS